MSLVIHKDSNGATGAKTTPPDEVPVRAPNSPSPAPASEAPATPANSSPVAAPSSPSAAPPRRSRKWLLLAGIVAAVAASVHFLVPWVDMALNTVSTDDAYVNGHVTMVAPRVPGQVKKVLVDDNNRVKKGEVLIQLDKEPYQVQVALKRAALRVAEKNLTAAQSKARGLEALLGSQRWKLQVASEQVDAMVAQLQVKVANLRNQEATHDRYRAEYERARVLVRQTALSREQYDQAQQLFRSAEAAVKQAREEVAQVRVSLGLAPEPEKGKSLTDVPPDLNQTSSSVRAALTDCMQTIAQLGLPLEPIELTPNQVLEKFRGLHKKGNIDRILQDLVPNVPAVMQAQADLDQARHDLEQAELNLRYCDVVSEIDGVVTSRNVNPGNNAQAGQAVMAVRSITEIWIDANFKETQLADLRIGQRVQCEVDMYGSHKEFEGRITGFTMGTGQTLALLPPQNATGNFVKIVQRLPVKIELTGYDPEHAPLFSGLSVTPYVYFKEPPTGPNAGRFLQPWTAEPSGQSFETRGQKSDVRDQKSK